MSVSRRLMHVLLLSVWLCCSIFLSAQGNAPQADKTSGTAPPLTGSFTVGFKAIRNAGDLNYFRERVGERAGLTLHSASLRRDWTGFHYFTVESLFTPENNSRAVLTFGSVEDFRLRLKYDRIQNYYSTSSTHFTPAAPIGPTPAALELFSLPGDLTLRRTVGEVDWRWNLRGKALVYGGYSFRRSNGSDLQLVGGSYYTVLDGSLPTRQTLNTFHHTYRLGLDFSVGPFQLHLLGEIENLNTRDSFPQPQVEGFALDRDLIYRNEAHAHSSRVAATFDISPRPAWFLSGGYLFQDLRNNPQWSRLELNRLFGAFQRRGDRLRAEAQFHSLFGQVLYVPRRAVAVRYRVVQEWGDGFGRGLQLRFENPVNQALTESLESRSSFDTRVHREQVSLSVVPVERIMLRARYGYDRRTRDYSSFFTPYGLEFAAGAAIREGEQKASIHTLHFDARFKAAERLQFLGGFGRRQLDILQNDTRLLRHYFLGDRQTNTNFYRAGLKYRTTRRAELEFDYRREARDYSAVTAGLSPARNTLELDLYAVSLNLHPTERWFLFGLLHYVRTDTRVLDLAGRSALATFSPLEYLVSNTGYLVGTNYLAWDRVNLGLQFQQNRAGGTERYRLHDAAASLEYEFNQHWSVGARYQFFESSLPLTPANNHRTHVAQGLLNYQFSGGQR